MAIHKLDRLFKKKLGSHSTQPSADAWTKMESMLAQPKKKPVWFFYKIAAAILLLLTSAFVVFKYQVKDYERVNIASVDSLLLKKDNRIAFEHPKQIDIKTETNSDNDSIEVLQVESEKIKVKNNKDVIPSKLPKRKRIGYRPAVKDIKIQLASSDNTSKAEKSNTIKSSIPKEEIDYKVTIEDEMIAMTDSVRIEIPEAVKFNNSDIKTLPKEKERKAIRIIYKRGNNSSKTLVAVNDTTSRKKIFQSIKNATKNISSGDLIAKIRDAKDDFFSQGIDFKKSK